MAQSVEKYMKLFETKVKLYLPNCCAFDSLHLSVRSKNKCKPPDFVRKLLSPQIRTVLTAKMPKSILTFMTGLQ